MHYDFIEVGTSDFKTCIEKANTDTVGISIEPVKYYLDRLPNKDNVIKLNIGISNDIKKKSKVYYLEPEQLKKFNLPEHLRGCNSVGEIHPAIPTRCRSEVKSQEIELVPLGDVFEEYNVSSVNLLKLDTEGMDCEILIKFYNYIVLKNKTNWPKEIFFESNDLANKKLLKIVYKKYKDLGYNLTIFKYDSSLKLAI